MWGGTTGRLAVGVIGTATTSAYTTFKIISLSPEDLPDRWWLLSTLNGIVLGGITDAASLSPERQSVLADYVSGGGVIIVDALDADALPAGPVKAAITAARAMPAGRATSGFGRYVTSMSPGSSWINDDFGTAFRNGRRCGACSKSCPFRRSTTRFRSGCS